MFMGIRNVNNTLWQMLSHQSDLC